MQQKNWLWFLLFLTVLSGCSEDKVETTDSSAPPIPIVFISLEKSKESITKEAYKEGFLQIIGGEMYEDLSAEVRIRGRGNSTWNFPKKPYQIKFELKEKVLGMAADKIWVLLANYSDKSMLRTELAFELGKKSNLKWTPESRFVELVINGEYVGTYQLTQKVEESSNRVNIGDEGFLLEIDRIERLNAGDVYFETDNYLFNIKAPNLEFDDDQFKFVQEFITKAEETLLGDNFNDPTEGYTKYIDRAAFIEWYLINEITKNNDAKFYTSVYMSLVPGGKIKMGPIWDFDISLGNINYNSNEEPEGFWVRNADWIEKLYEDPAFVADLKERFNFFYSVKQEIEDHIITKALYLENCKNYERWETLGEYVWPNHVYYETYQEELDHLVEWFDTRMEWLNVAINDL